MPTSPLISNQENFQSLKDWLNQNLNDKNSIKACCKEICNVTDYKGIYFWFMHPRCYNILNKYISNFSSLPDKYVKSINGIDYDLVYLGTAGTGKMGNSNLFERLRWHLCEKHNDNKVCRGYLSTLRAGLSALLADDLIENKVEETFNSFVCENMYIYWLDYQSENNIDNDEKILIKTIRPLLNIKNNPNAKANSFDNNTKEYRKRRLFVMKNTRFRIQCKRESDKTMAEITNPTNDAISYNDQIIDEANGCVEYTVSLDQDIDVVTRGIDDLCLGKCSISIYDSNNYDNIFNWWKIRGTGNNNNHDAQNIYTYFSKYNTNEQYNGKRSENIKKWMLENRVEEITVRVCPK
jgi:hypothetical protein